MPLNLDRVKLLAGDDKGDEGLDAHANSLGDQRRETYEHSAACANIRPGRRLVALAFLL